MKRTTKYVGFDVHQATTVASVRDDSGRVIARSVLETHGPSIVEFLRGTSRSKWEPSRSGCTICSRRSPIE